MSFSRKLPKPKVLLNEAGLYDYAVKALGRHMRTEAELRRLMLARVKPGTRGDAVIAAVIARLKEQRYLDDQSFAETYARLRQENDKLGARRVRQNLRQKGVKADVVEQALEAQYADTNEETLARRFLDSRHLLKPQNEKETARLTRRLVAAGFSTGVIYRILRNWDVPDEALASLEYIDEEPNREES